MSKYTGLTPAQDAANRRFNEKTYRKLTFYIRLNEDADILESLDAARAQGMNKREWMRELFDLANKK